MSSKSGARATIATAFLTATMASNGCSSYVKTFETEEPFLSERISANGVTKQYTADLPVTDFPRQMLAKGNGCLKNGKWFDTPPEKDFTPRLREAREKKLYSKCETCVKSLGHNPCKSLDTEKYHSFKKEKPHEFVSPKFSFLPSKILMQLKGEKTEKKASIVFEYSDKYDGKGNSFSSSFPYYENFELAAEIQQWIVEVEDDQSSKEESI
eukprot:GHVP01053722.1.p1 GENE.GHVP01053722.1~~GHVP01053722.1.p1  ORF type:complete len:211 (-),score=43.08 GHVP01053722.1:104-736(-)